MQRQGSLPLPRAAARLCGGIGDELLGLRARRLCALLRLALARDEVLRGLSLGARAQGVQLAIRGGLRVRNLGVGVLRIAFRLAPRPLEHLGGLALRRLFERARCIFCLSLDLVRLATALSEDLRYLVVGPRAQLLRGDGRPRNGVLRVGRGPRQDVRGLLLRGAQQVLHPRAKPLVRGLLRLPKSLVGLLKRRGRDLRLVRARGRGLLRGGDVGLEASNVSRDSVSIKATHRDREGEVLLGHVHSFVRHRVS